LHFSSLTTHVLKNHFLDFRPAFETARAAGLKITLHCGTSIAT
jgi:hypothetical protein